ncbi:hypothetical protein V757_07290 [Pelistega indica]|uniref:DUF1852 domain-containing protein n=1 Tax=Pelistega indica TaxID=1414851 RepID=V8G2L9_9BURK|nr:MULTISPECIES: DUF1852 domain-containing protein [Pelistega]ETD70769.1 hypothetical protein V757_07290 [Pelistega indica]
MSNELVFKLKRTPFDENYEPSTNTRLTTNFANLARGESRQSNLRKAIDMINNRFNNLADWDNPTGDRYAVELEIISVDVDIEKNNNYFPIIEVLKTTVVDSKYNKRYEGIVGNSFSSYVRDYDFSVVLLEHNKNKKEFSLPDAYGELHGKLFKAFLNSDVYKENFTKQPVICLSVSSSKVYKRTQNHHPILGIEYEQDEYSLTDDYFAKMGLHVRYFMPKNSVAPLAFYFSGDLLNDYSNIELIATISTMESFQKIYRPEIYNANTAAGKIYQPSLTNQDYSSVQVEYDRVERSQLAINQGKFTETYFIKPYQTILTQWAANYSL